MIKLLLVEDDANLRYVNKAVWKILSAVTKYVQLLPVKKG